MREACGAGAGGVEVLATVGCGGLLLPPDAGCGPSWGEQDP